jgi:LysR family nitrogen assimilation transcriptional regulator
MNLNRIELRHLRYFAAVARNGSVTAAANYLRISQPALTYQLKQIEEELGVLLLERTPRGVSLTKAGTVFLEKADAVLGEFGSIQTALAPLRQSKTPQIIVGMAPTPARALAIDLLEANARSGPFIVNIREGFSDDLLKMVVSGELDCALSYNPTDVSRQVEAIPLASEELFAVATSATFGTPARSTIRFDELIQLPLVLDSTQQAGRRLIDRLAAKLDLRPDIVTATSVAVKRELVARNNRCTVVPYGLYSDELTSGSLEARRIIDPCLDRTLCIVLLRSREKALVKLIAQLKLMARKHINAGTLRWRRPMDNPGKRIRT